MTVEQSAEKMVFRNTHVKTGRNISVTPNNSTNKHLSYGRTILNQEVSSVAFESGGQETGLICLSGNASVNVDGKPFTLDQYDAIYIPRDSKIEISTVSGVDIAEYSADVENKYPLQYVSYKKVKTDAKLHFTAGTPGQMREVNIMLGNNMEAGRLLAG